MLLVAAGEVWGCSCAGTPSTIEALAKADVVVSGVVVARVDIIELRSVDGKPREPGVVSTGDLIGWQVAVGDVWKGTVEDTIVVYSERDNASCGYRFVEGESYLVYAYRHDAEKIRKLYDAPNADGTWLSTGVCSRTKKLKDAGEDLKVLSQPERLRGDE
jgi:hypothetical protein